MTLAEGKTARFPDAVSERGRRHLETLTRLRRAGERAVLLYVVQRADCTRVEAASEIDPEYANALLAADRAGVEIRAVGARVRAREIRLEKSLSVVL